MLFGVVGQAMSGKSTLAELLVSAYKVKHNCRPTLELAFADALKRSMAALFSIDLSKFHDQTHKREVAGVLGHQYTHRQLLTTGGDGLRSTFGQDLFVRLLREKIVKFQHKHGREGLIVVTDVRYAVEADMIRKMGGTLVRITRDASPSSDGVTAVSYDSLVVEEKRNEKGEAKHSSETEQLHVPVHVQVTNNGKTVDALRSMVVPMLLTGQGKYIDTGRPPKRSRHV